MTEIPEHLRKPGRGDSAKKAEEGAGGGGAPAAAAGAGALPASQRGREPHPDPPARALERGKAQAAGRAAGHRRWGRHRRRLPAPHGCGRRHGRSAAGRPAPAVRTQRLLTVVQVRFDPGRRRRAPPRRGPRVAPPAGGRVRLACWRAATFLLVFSIVVNAPLLTLANVNQTPNPSKAPWYFLGLQELLTMFHPMVAGVHRPGHRPLRPRSWRRTPTATRPPSAPKTGSSPTASRPSI